MCMFVCLWVSLSVCMCAYVYEVDRNLLSGIICTKFCGTLFCLTYNLEDRSFALIFEHLYLILEMEQFIYFAWYTLVKNIFVLCMM
jgi:hypothetical protein